MKVKKGDKVVVIAGKDKGTSGRVERVMSDENRVVVEGVNIKKRHQRARRRGEKGEIIELASPIDVSNVMIEDPKTKKPTRVGYRVNDDGTKVRYAKKSGEVLK